MPIYEYHCTACGSHTEALQKFSDSPLVDCTKCGEPKLEKQLSQSSFSLKGGGWYADGYGGPTSKADEGSSTDAAATSDPKSADAKSSDSKQSTDQTASSDTKKSSDTPKNSDPKKRSNTSSSETKTSGTKSASNTAKTT